MAIERIEPPDRNHPAVEAFELGEVPTVAGAMRELLSQRKSGPQNIAGRKS